MILGRFESIPAVVFLNLLRPLFLLPQQSAALKKTNNSDVTDALCTAAHKNSSHTEITVLFTEELQQSLILLSTLINTTTDEQNQHTLY